MLKAAVIGLGVGEQHLLGYLRHPGCEVAAMCDHSAEKLRQVSARYPGIRAVRSAAEVLDDPTIQIVSIASYDSDHFEQVMAALEAGKHVFVEKPLCQTLEQARTIKAAWARHGGRVKLGSNLVLRAAPLYRWVRGQLDAGKMGRVYAFDGDYLYGRIHKITEGWRAEMEEYSVMAGGGVHLIDLMLWFTGERPSTVSAVGNRICTEGTAFRYDDFVAATFTFPTGAVGRITANFGCVHRHQHVVRTFGTQATFLYDDRGPRWHFTRDPAAEAAPLTLSPVPASKADLIGPFVDAILNNEDLGAETQTHLDTISICLASDHSLRTGTVREIEYV